MRQVDMRRTETMSAQGLPWLVRLYPPAWRARYGDELAGLLEMQPLSLFVLLDVLGGALDAHVHASWLRGGGIPMERRLRLCEVAFFCAFMLFVVGFLPFGRIADPTSSFDAAAKLHPELATIYHGVNILAAVTALVIALGGVPVLLASIFGAWRSRDWRALRPFLGAVALVIVYVAYTLIAAYIVGNRPGMTANPSGPIPVRPIDTALVLGFLLFTLLGAALGPTLIGLVVARGDVPLRLLRFALGCAGVALVTMAAVLAGTAGMTFLMHTQAPSLDASQDTGLPMLIVMIACMVIAEIVGLVAFFRGLRLRPEPAVEHARAA